MVWVRSALAAPNVPTALQGAILSKVLKYDQSLESKPKLVILANSQHASDAANLAKAFSTLGGSVTITSPKEVGADIRGAGGIYVFPGLLSESVRTLCLNHKVLSLSGDADDAAMGRASVGVGHVGGKPQIIVHLPRVKAEGHKLSSRVLKLAKVVH